MVNCTREFHFVMLPPPYDLGAWRNPSKAFKRHDLKLVCSVNWGSILQKKKQCAVLMFLCWWPSIAPCGPDSHSISHHTGTVSQRWFQTIKETDNLCQRNRVHVSNHPGILSSIFLTIWNHLVTNIVRTRILFNGTPKLTGVSARQIDDWTGRFFLAPRSYSLIWQNWFPLIF